MTPDLDCAKKTEELLEVIAAPDGGVGSTGAFLEAYGLKPGKVMGVGSGDLYRLYRQWTAECGVWWERPGRFLIEMRRAGYRRAGKKWKGPRWMGVDKASAVRVLGWVMGNPAPAGFADWYREECIPSRRKDE